MRIFYLLSFILLLFLQVKSQDRSTPSSDREPVSRFIKFYPNPATSIINFDLQGTANKNFNFQIYNFLGKKVFELNNVTQKTIVNLNDFYRGVYIFQLRDRNGKIIDSGKFQVSK